MPTLHDKLTEQFYRWELRGRGWQVHGEPVYLEPPFVPFLGHQLPEAPIVDDGRRPTLLSSLYRKLSGQSQPPPVPPEPEEEPEPVPLVRDGLVELQTSLPADLDISKDAFEQFLRNLSLCREPVSFEILGEPGRVSVLFTASERDVSHVRRQLQAYFPEAVFQPRRSALEETWFTCSGEDELVVEFGLAREFMFPLASGGKLDPFVGIVGALSELRADELGLFQFLFQPVHEPWSDSIVGSVTHANGKPFFVNQPELAGAAENKVSRPLHAAVVRIAIKSESFDRTMEIACDMAASLRVFANPQGNELIPLTNEEYPFIEHVDDMLRRQSRRSGMLLNTDELIGFVHLPGSAVRSAVFERDSGKTKAAPEIVRNETGLLLGSNVHFGESIPVRLTPEQRVYHTHIIGATGTGKSTLLLNLIKQDIESGQGIAVFDPHGDLVDKILGIIPPERINDIVLVDPSDDEYAVGFNILSAHSEHEKTLLASDLVSVFQRLSTSWGDQMHSVLQNAILAFLNSNRHGTLADLRRFLIEPAFRVEFLKSVSDPNILYYWHKGFAHLPAQKSIGPVLTRLEMFLAQRPIAHMVSQPENRLNFDEIMDTGKIFLAKLPEGLLGRENSYLLGAVLVSKFQQLVMARQAKKVAARRNFWIYIDEFANFITPSMAEILSGARKYRIGLTLAHHELHQLERSKDVASAVMTHPFTRIVFRVGDDDARKLAEGFSFFEAGDLKNLETGQAICRVERSNFDFNLSIPLSNLPDDGTMSARQELVIAASRDKYGTPRAQIEAMLREAWEVETSKGASVKTKSPPGKAIATSPVEAVAPTPPPFPKSPEPLKPSEVPKEIAPNPVSEIPTLKTSETHQPTAAPVAPAANVSETAHSESKRPDKGIGGNQHNLIRERIEQVARALGYTASREERTGPGEREQIDLALEKRERAIACEIAITTPIDHEVGNVAKILPTRFSHIAVIATTDDRLEKIKAGVHASFSPEQASRVGFYQPDAFIAYLQRLASEDKAAPSVPTEKTVGKWKVKSTAVKLTPEELKEREAAKIAMLAREMRKKK